MHKVDCCEENCKILSYYMNSYIVMLLKAKKHIMVVHAFLQLEDYLWIQKVNFFHVKEFRKKIQKCASEVLDSGFDFDKMSFLLNHGKMIKEKCLGCWNLRMCAYCLAQIPKDNQILTENMLLQQCENSKESTLLLLYKLCILVEFGYKGNENLQVLK